MNMRADRWEAGGTASEFLQRYSPLVTRMCWSLADRAGIDRDELVQDASLRVMEKYPKLRLDDARSQEDVITTWIGWQIRAARKNTVRRRQKEEARYTGLSPEAWNTVEDTCSYSPMTPRNSTRRSTPGSGARGVHGPAMPKHVQTQLMLDKALAHATPAEREAVTSYLGGYNDSELRAKHGFSKKTQNNRIASLRRRVSRGVPAPPVVEKAKVDLEPVDIEALMDLPDLSKCKLVPVSCWTPAADVEAVKVAGPRFAESIMDVPDLSRCKLAPLSWYWALSVDEPEQFEEAWFSEAMALEQEPGLYVSPGRLPIDEAVARWRAGNPSATVSAVRVSLGLC